MPMRATKKCQWTTPISLELSISRHEKNRNANVSAQMMENVPS